jgi:precorrin-2 dehydrogenase/sirohydrochlorin ferrochelatase
MPQSRYPILLDVTDRLCVIIGGGTVAVRKARSLLSAGAQNLHMIAPVFAPNVPEAVREIRESYRPEHLNQAGIVFAATNVPEVNDAVVRDAKARGILVSRADDDEEFAGDFVTPARLSKGPVSVTVSAGSAALSVMIRDQLDSRWEPGWTAMAQAMIQLRPEIKTRWDPTTRLAIFHDLATSQAMDIVLAKGIDGLRDWLRQRYGAGT